MKINFFNAGFLVLLLLESFLFAGKKKNKDTTQDYNDISTVQNMSNQNSITKSKKKKKNEDVEKIPDNFRSSYQDPSGDMQSDISGKVSKKNKIKKATQQNETKKDTKKQDTHSNQYEDPFGGLDAGLFDTKFKPKTKEKQKKVTEEKNKKAIAAKKTEGKKKEEAWYEKATSFFKKNILNSDAGKAIKDQVKETASGLSQIAVAKGMQEVSNKFNKVIHSTPVNGHSDTQAKSLQDELPVTQEEDFHSDIAAKQTEITEDDDELWYDDDFDISEPYASTTVDGVVMPQKNSLVHQSSFQGSPKRRKNLSKNRRKTKVRKHNR